MGKNWRRRDRPSCPPIRGRTPSLLRWLPALAWMGVIFYLSARPDLPSPPEPWLDMLLEKAGHAAVYGVLAWLYLYALRGDRPATDRLRLLSLALAAAYGLSDEFHQAFVPGRDPSVADLLTDVVGAALALALERRAARLPAPSPR